MNTPENLVADCGCMLVTRIGASGENIVTLIPHDPECEVVKQSVAYAETQGKDVSLTMGVESAENPVIHHTMACDIYSPIKRCNCGVTD